MLNREEIFAQISRSFDNIVDFQPEGDDDLRFFHRKHFSSQKLESKNDQEQKPRKIPTSNDLKAENSEYGVSRNYYKPWKDNDVPIEVIVEDYDERQNLPESRQKFVYDA